MSDKSAADNMPLDEATEFLVRGHRKYFNQNPSKESLIRHIKRLHRGLERKEDLLEFERSERESFVRELEELEQKVISLAESIKGKATRRSVTGRSHQ